MITSIKIGEQSFPGYQINEDDSKSLSGVSRINILIGKNNSGKSRFLRSLLKNELSVQLSTIDNAGLAEFVASFKTEMAGIIPSDPGGSFDAIDAALQALPDLNHIGSVKEVQGLRDSLIGFTKMNSSMVSDGRGHNPQFVFNRINLVASDYLTRLNDRFKIDDSYGLYLTQPKAYIPILRGLRAVQMILPAGEGAVAMDHRQDNYLARTKNDYSLAVSERLSIHTGLELFDKVTRLLLGDHDDRLKIKKFEEFLSSTFFNQQPVHIVPRSGRDVVFIKIGDEPQYPIYDLGEGIQSIILLTFPLFFSMGEKRLFFFEEPETHLHPGLERIFIETLRDDRFSDFQYFMTSHSNHILDLTQDYSDISVYSFEKIINEGQPRFLVKNVNSARRHLLDLLGVRNSSVFLSNCTIWVEGITDRLYLRKYLEIIQKELGENFKEDYHYAFLEYAGSNITHWSFLDSDDDSFPNINIEGLCSKIFLLADSDGVDLPAKRSKEKKRQRLEQLKQNLGNNLYVTKAREVENLLAPHIVKQVITHYEGEEARLDFKGFDKRSYSDEYLGDFIQTKIVGLRKKYANEYGTINDKVNFCKAAVGFIKAKKDMSDEAIELATKLCDFIKNANS